MLKELDYQLSRFATFLCCLFILWLFFALFVFDDGKTGTKRQYLRGDFDL